MAQAVLSQNHVETSPLLRIPAELRLMIYRHLLSPPTGNEIKIRTRERFCNGKPNYESTGVRRTPYFALERNFGRCSYKTTYGHDTSSDGGDATELHPEIMAVNRRIYEETTYHLYASHDFRFGQHLDAFGPFVGDLTPTTQSLVQSVSLRCALHSPCCCGGGDSRFWATMSQRLQSLPKLRKLRLVVQGGKPTSEWDGPMELGVSDIKFLYATRHECLDWVRELAKVESLEEVVIEADVRPIAKPESSSTLVYAALSASIETSLLVFMNEVLDIPAKLAEKPKEEATKGSGESSEDENAE